VRFDIHSEASTKNEPKYREIDLCPQENKITVIGCLTLRHLVQDIVHFNSIQIVYFNIQNTSF